jgi:hypothetical protein
MKKSTFVAPTRGLRILFAFSMGVSLAGPLAPRAAHAKFPNMQQMAEGALSKAWDATLRPMLGVSFADAKKAIEAAVGGFKNLGKQLEPFLKALPKDSKDLQNKIFAGAEAIFSLPEKAKEKFKKLVWVKDKRQQPTSPFDPRNDKAIGAFLRGEVKGFFNARVFRIIPEPLRVWLTKSAGDVLAQLGTPFVRFVQFVRGKVKAGLEVVIKTVMRGAVLADSQLKKLRVPKFLISALKGAADLLGRTVGSLGTYVLNLSPPVKAVVMDVVDMLSNTAEPLNDALTSMSGLASVMGGDTRVKLDEEGERALAAAIKKIRAKRGSRAWKARVQSVRADLLAKSFKRAFGLKEAKVREAVARILAALADAFAAFARPALEQAASLLNMALQPVVSLVIRAIGALIDCIPEAGGIIAAFWTTLAPVAAQILADLVPKIVIGVAVDFVKEELKDFEDFFVDMWAGRTGGKDRQLMGDFMAAMKRFQEAFKVATTGLSALKDGLTKGAAALFEGPVVSAILRKLPLPQSLLQAVASAISTVLGEIFKPAKVELNPSKIAKALLNDATLQGHVRDFLLKDSPLPKNSPLTSAIVKGLVAAWNKVGREVDARGFGVLLQGNVILAVLADAVSEAKEDFADFIAGRIRVCGVREGVVAALDGVADLLRKGKEIPRLLGRGLKSLIPEVVRRARPAVVKLLSCNIKDPRFAELIVPAVDSAAEFFSEEANIQKLTKGGFPAFVALVLRVAAVPVGALFARGLNDGLLSGELATAIRTASDSLFDKKLVVSFTQGGMKGALLELGRIFRAPIVGALSRRVRDADFKEALEGSYDNILASLGPEKFSKEGLVAIFVPWAQLAFKKAIDAFGVALDKGKAKLLAFVEGFRGALPFVGALKEVVTAASDAGRAKFVELARPCAAEIGTEVGASLEKIIRCTVEAGKAAFKAGAVAGVKSALIGVLDAFGESMAKGQAKLLAFVNAQATPAGLPAWVVRIKEVAVASASAGAEAGRVKFVEDAKGCAEKITEESAADMSAVQATLSEVVSCMLTAAKAAFGAAVEGAKSGAAPADAPAAGESEPATTQPAGESQPEGDAKPEAETKPEGEAQPAPEQK